MSRGIFVTGTDTGVGKTFVACALLRSLAAQGLRAVGMKPVAAGLDATRGVAEDVRALMQAGNVRAPVATINPYAFAPPIAPHVAAAEAGVVIRLERIAQCYEDLAAVSDVVVVEGAGGALVPLGGGTDMLDIPWRLRLPVLMVVGVRLGCINHALLTAVALRARGLVLAGWVANGVDPTMSHSEATVASIAAALGPPLARFGYGEREPAFDARACVVVRGA